ncbi:hypothetical protein ACJX0J_023746, partial [Zea mays]
NFMHYFIVVQPERFWKESKMGTICDPEPQVLCCLVVIYPSSLLSVWLNQFNMVMHNHELLEKLVVVVVGVIEEEMEV